MVDKNVAISGSLVVRCGVRAAFTNTDIPFAFCNWWDGFGSWSWIWAGGVGSMNVIRAV